MKPCRRVIAVLCDTALVDAFFFFWSCHSMLFVERSSKTNVVICEKVMLCLARAALVIRFGWFSSWLHKAQGFISASF